MKRVAFVTIAFAFVAVAFANDGAITGVGGTIELLDEHPSISLVAEHIHARVLVEENAIETECIFVLANNGPAGKVAIGFPEFYNGDTGPKPFDFFRSYVDGEPAECVREKGKSGSGGAVEHWWTKTVGFDAGQTRIIRDLYRSPAGHSIGGGPGSPIRTFEYTLYTGASWAGEIGTATILVSFEPCPPGGAPSLIQPNPTRSDQCEYVWNFRNFEPGRSGPPSIHVSWSGVAIEE